MGNNILCVVFCLVCITAESVLSLIAFLAGAYLGIEILTTLF